MSYQGWRLPVAALLFGCTALAFAVCAGCKSVESLPPSAARSERADLTYNAYDPDDDEYSGRLFRTGKYRQKKSEPRGLRRTGDPGVPAAAPGSAPAHAPTLGPPAAYPPPSPPAANQTAVPPGTAYGQPPAAAAAPNPYAPTGQPPPYAAPGHRAPPYPPAGQPSPYAPPPQPNPASPYPTTPAAPYPGTGNTQPGANPVIPASATEPVPPGGSTRATPPADYRDLRPKAEEDEGFGLSDLSPENIGKTVKKATGRGPDENYARKQLEEGRALFADKKYADAVKPLGEAADRWPNSPLAEDALFLKAECLFFTDQYPEAQDTYGKLLADYKNSRYLDTVTRRLFAIGQYWIDLHRRDPHWPVTPNFADGSRPRFDTFGRALRAFETIRLEDPTGPLADDSMMAIATAYFENERFEDASVFFDLLRTEYPESEHQAKAHTLGLQSKMRSYQGAHYDDTPLSEAEKIAEQALMQFRHQLGDEAAELRRARNRIEHEKAERDWAVAQFYDNKRQYGAARIYYREIIENYPHTRFAEMAEKRMYELQGEPDEPPNRYAWLTEAFEPEDDPDAALPDVEAP